MNDSTEVLRLLRRLENDPMVERRHRSTATQAIKFIVDLEGDLETHRKLDVMSGRVSEANDG